jgi:dipeptidyl aminopeptidase/acylaminoacyl peptidase
VKHCNGGVCLVSIRGSLQILGVFALLVAIVSIVERTSLGADDAAVSARHVRVIDAAGGVSRRLTEVVGRPNMGSPAWSNDGTKIAFDACGEDGDFGHSQIYVVNSDGTWPRNLGPGSVPHWSPDDKMLAFHRYGKEEGAWVANLVDGTRLRIAQGCGSPRWRPHRQTIGCLQWGENIAEVRLGTFGADNETMKPLLPAGLDPYWGWSWSPDGDGVCFMSRRAGKSDRRELLIVQLNDVPGNSSESKVVTRVTGAIYTHVAWSPDGKKILFSMKDKGDERFQLYTVDPESKAAPQAILGQSADYHNVDAAWSPDGKQIVYVAEGAGKEAAEQDNKSASVRRD